MEYAAYRLKDTPAWLMIKALTPNKRQIRKEHEEMVTTVVTELCMKGGSLQVSIK